jgi:hypothetical protein
LSRHCHRQHYPRSPDGWQIVGRVIQVAKKKKTALVVIAQADGSDIKITVSDRDRSLLAVSAGGDQFFVPNLILLKQELSKSVTILKEEYGKSIDHFCRFGHEQSTYLSIEISGGVRWQTRYLQFLPKGLNHFMLQRVTDSCRTRMYSILQAPKLLTFSY